MKSKWKQEMRRNEHIMPKLKGLKDSHSKREHKMRGDQEESRGEAGRIAECRTENKRKVRGFQDRRIGEKEKGGSTIRR